MPQTKKGADISEWFLLKGIKLVSVNRLLSGCERVSADFACFSPRPSLTTIEEKQNKTHDLSHKLQPIKTKAVQMELRCDLEPISSVIGIEAKDLEKLLRGDHVFF